MKFITTLFATTVSTFILSDATAMVSPAVACCSEKGGTYQIVDGPDGQSGVCIKDNVYYEEMTFLQNNCSDATPTTYTYSVYAVNNCDNAVSAEFVLRKSPHGGDRKGGFEDLAVGSCAYVGPTNLDSVSFESEGSFVSSGQDSCKNIGSSNNDQCNLLGMNDNACVVTLC